MMIRIVLLITLLLAGGHNFNPQPHPIGPAKCVGASCETGGRR
jgi:hypothetical protein